MTHHPHPKHEATDALMEQFRATMAEQVAAQRAQAKHRMPPRDVSSKAWAERYGSAAATPQAGFAAIPGMPHGYQGGEVDHG